MKMQKIIPHVTDTRKLESFFHELSLLNERMDSEYSRVAEFYGFTCNGCGENCCETLFYHHTWVEVFYLRSAFEAMEPRMREFVYHEAESYLSILDSFEASRKKNSPTAPFRRMCPLNINQKCILYRFRPMICRLHGIPHEVAIPGRPRIFGRGCAEFQRQAQDMPYRVFDRTPFYMDLSRIEDGFRREFDINVKCNLTVAHILTLR